MLRQALSTLFLLLCFLIGGGLIAQVAISKQGQGAPREKDPVLRADGQELYFTRPDFINNKGTDNAADIWVMSRYADGSWGRALNPGSPINSFAHDRALALSPDGSRMAVLRTGSADYLDLLETSGRNWRILDSWPLPGDVAPRYDVTFDPNGLTMVYSAYKGGNLDLFRRAALAGGKWSSPQALRQVNGPGNETAPSLAPDGRTLYFQRDGGRWFRQTAPGERAVEVSIPGSVTQFSASMLGSEIIATVVPSASRGERLHSVKVSAADLPPVAELYRGFLIGPPAAGERVAHIGLSDGRELDVLPDAANRYAVFLRAGEQVVGPANSSVEGTGTNGLATTSRLNGPATDRGRLQAGITSRQASLDRLDAERKKYDLVAPKTADPELEALRARYRQSNSALGDTLPPRSRRDSRYAAELEELERMKAKFRKQQNEKQSGRSGEPRWAERSAATPAASTVAPANSYGTRDPAPLNYADREQAYQDSTRLAAEIRAGLSRDAGPRVYERQAWENEVRQGLPRQTEPSPDEAARLDADYQRQLAELEALRAKLKGLDERNVPTQAPRDPYARTAPNAQARQPQQWRARSPEPAAQQPPYQESVYRRAPATHGQPQARSPYPATTAPPSGMRGAAMPAGITFIPNTAYPDTRGYTGLDNLVTLIRQSTTALEIRVHTPADMDPRVAQLLSEERAVTIRNFLIDRGINAANFKAVGFGNNLAGRDGERVEVVR